MGINFLKLIQSNLGSKTAQYYIAKQYYYGEGVKRSYTKAFKLYEKAAKQGLPDAQYVLGYMYEFKQGVSKNIKKAKGWYTKAAEQGHSEAMCRLGVLHKNDTIPEYDLAFPLFKKSAEMGNVNAKNQLAECYQLGYGTDINLKEALRWYEAAGDDESKEKIKEIKPIVEILVKAEQGDAEAQFSLGLRYADGNGVEQDFAKAAEWYTKAAEQGQRKALVNLGNLYVNGQGVAKDMDKAIEWYTKAAELGDVRTQLWLAKMYQNEKSDAHNDEKAFEWFSKVAEKGNAEGQCYLAGLYASGKGVAKDYAKAIEYWKMAAEQGNSTAMSNVGICYLDGYGVEKDSKKAITWLSKACIKKSEFALKKLIGLAEEGDFDAMVALGDVYRHPDYCDYKKAVSWYSKAAKKDHPRGLYRLGCLYEFGQGVETNKFQSIKLIEKAATLGDEDAMNSIACEYYSGDYVRKDLKEAIYWWSKLFANGKILAGESLMSCYEEMGNLGIAFTIAKKLYDIYERNGDNENRRLIQLRLDYYQSKIDFNELLKLKEQEQKERREQERRREIEAQEREAQQKAELEKQDPEIRVLVNYEYSFTGSDKHSNDTVIKLRRSTFNALLSSNTSNIINQLRSYIEGGGFKYHTIYNMKIREL